MLLRLPAQSTGAPGLLAAPVAHESASAGSKDSKGARGSTQIPLPPVRPKRLDSRRPLLCTVTLSLQGNKSNSTPWLVFGLPPLSQTNYTHQWKTSYRSPSGLSRRNRTPSMKSVRYHDRLIPRFPAEALLYVWIRGRFQVTLHVRRHHHHHPLLVMTLNRSRSEKEVEPMHYQAKIEIVKANPSAIPGGLMKYRTHLRCSCRSH